MSLNNGVNQEKSSLQQFGINTKRLLLSVPWWASLLLIFIGLIGTGREVASTQPMKQSDLEDFSNFVLLFGLIFFGIWVYRRIFRWTEARSKPQTPKLKALTTLGAIFIPFLVLAIFFEPTAKIRFAVDPQAKTSYEASVAQAKADIELAAKVEKDRIASSELKAAQESAAKVLKRNQVLAAALKERKVAAQAEAKAKAKADQAVATAGDRSNLTVIRNIKRDLNLYSKVWAQFLVGTGPLYEVSGQCALLGFDYPILRDMNFESSTLTSLQSSAVDALWEVKDRCAYAFKKETGIEMSDAAVYAARASQFLAQMVRKMTI